MDGEINRMLGELKEFKEVTIFRLCRIEDKVDALNNFRWKAAGVLAAVFVFGEIVVHLKDFIGG